MRDARDDDRTLVIWRLHLRWAFVSLGLFPSFDRGMLKVGHLWIWWA